MRADAGAREGYEASLPAPTTTSRSRSDDKGARSCSRRCCAGRAASPRSSGVRRQLPADRLRATPRGRQNTTSADAARVQAARGLHAEPEPVTIARPAARARLGRSIRRPATGVKLYVGYLRKLLPDAPDTEPGRDHYAASATAIGARGLMWNCVPVGMAQTKQVVRVGMGLRCLRSSPTRPNAPRLSHQPRVRVRFTSNSSHTGATTASHFDGGSHHHGTAITASHFGSGGSHHGVRPTPQALPSSSALIRAGRRRGTASRGRRRHRPPSARCPPPARAEEHDLGHGSSSLRIAASTSLPVSLGIIRRGQPHRADGTARARAPLARRGPAPPHNRHGAAWRGRDRMSSSSSAGDQGRGVTHTAAGTDVESCRLLPHSARRSCRRETRRSPWRCRARGRCPGSAARAPSGSGRSVGRAVRAPPPEFRSPCPRPRRRRARRAARGERRRCRRRA